MEATFSRNNSVVEDIEILRSFNIVGLSHHVNFSDGFATEERSSTYFPKLFYYMAALVVFSLFVVLINLRVICIVTDVSRKKFKPINVFIVHLSSVAIGFAFFLGGFILEKLGAFTINGQPTCMILRFTRDTMWAVHPLNIVVLMYERILTFRESSGNLIVTRIISGIWIIAAIESLPSIIMTQFQTDELTGRGKCVQTLLMGSMILSVGRVLMLFLLQYLLVVGYMCHALFQIRSKIKFLYIIKPIPTRRVRSAVRRLRFVYFYSIFFVIMWLPTGFLHLAYSTLGRTGKDYSVLQGYLLVIILLDYFFLAVSPVVVICCNEDVSRNRLFGCGASCKENVSTAVQSETLEMECRNEDESKV